MKLVWKNLYEISDEKLAYNIENFEKKYEVILPNSYKEILKKKAGGSLLNKSMVKNFKYKDEIIEIYLLAFNNEYVNLFTINEKRKDIIPKNIIIFGYDSTGNYYGFNYDNPNDPKIVCYMYEYEYLKSNLIEDKFDESELDEEKRKCYVDIYDNFDELLDYMRIAQKFWIVENYESEKSKEFKQYLSRYPYTF